MRVTILNIDDTTTMVQEFTSIKDCSCDNGQYSLVENGACD